MQVSEQRQRGSRNSELLNVRTVIPNRHAPLGSSPSRLSCTGAIPANPLVVLIRSRFRQSLSAASQS